MKYWKGDTVMSLKSTFLKAAINISIALAFPEAVIFQGLSSASLDFLADCYEDKKEKKSNDITYKLTKLYEDYCTNVVWIYLLKLFVLIQVFF